MRLGWGRSSDAEDRFAASTTRSRGKRLLQEPIRTKRWFEMSGVLSGADIIDGFLRSWSTILYLPKHLRSTRFNKIRTFRAKLFNSEQLFSPDFNRIQQIGLPALGAEVLKVVETCWGVMLSTA